ncbi:AFR218Wp [Eremothecium gossypii ATCC 10895]|uniref:Nuclear cap-binding protein complex subunit 1 n=1 Tax=Eremothecium gossypii (strain ATCC 10895 / CBS 109.51 / FGSC 9923 / NRRL Y-1056) TaxID=284811 RepID=NCBP1_EREGS|nr:AFR218Wp [Eremothecium gossypii ATCC 10895]Q754H6.2 RecName: Full=Nuclear cap-binding protein complex subunit 1; AltName: Full=80 kDa nuclear cap-binding protein; Short=CBP80; Short=NCBP 80 kDa subunit [Eremothecium gossypii ATCC 10895]AAS53589.2 AFR218Wp [Eremothecium gossypii ATCC 10895]
MSGMKRRYDYEEEDGYRDFRPRYSKRQRLPPVVQLCKDMLPDIRTIGESVKAFEEDIKFLSEAIINEFGNDEYFNNALLSTFNALILEQPHKQPAIALLTIVVNSGNPAAGKSVINYFYEKLQHLLDMTVVDDFEVTSNETGPWNKIKLTLRFLSLLSPVITLTELTNVYQRLFELAVQLNRSSDANTRNPLSEAIYTNTLLNIPYLFFFNKEDETLRTNVEDLIQYAESNYEVKTVDLSLTKEYNKNLPYEPVQWVQIVLSNVKNALANDMEELKNLFPDYQNLLPTSIEQQMFNDPLTIPEFEKLLPFSGLDKGLGSVDSMWKTPRTAFQVYLPNVVGDFSTVVPITTYTGMLFDDIIVDIVESLEFNRHEVARQVVTLDLYFKPGIFTEPGLSIAQLLVQHNEMPELSTYKIEDLAIENILGLIFKLPTVTQSFAYFYTLLVEICQNSPKAIAPVFGRAFRLFYNNLDNMDHELKMRYLDWFSIQMSNFNFSWKWNEWEQDSIAFSKSFYNPKITFAKNLIRKELRLTSNRPDVEDSLTPEFKQYLDASYISKDQLASYYQSFFEGFSFDPEVIKDNDLLFKNEVFPFHEKVQLILDYIHKQPLEKNISELESLLEDIKSAHGDKIPDFNRFTVTLLIQALVYSGNRSLSHANKYISDAKSDLVTILEKMEVPPEVKEQWIIEAVIRYWNCNSQNGFLIVDSFKHSELVTAKSILTFSLTDLNGQNLGLVDATSIESTFRTLTELALQQASDISVFEFVFERLLEIINDTVSQLGTNEEIVAPSVDNETMLDVDELARLDLIWKYESAVGFIKSILRKYSDEYSVLLDKFSAGLEQAVPHEPTRKQLDQWFNEIREL